MLDMVTLFGLIVGLSGIVVGQMLEGGSPSALIQGTAFMIVFGGTIGAVMVSTTKEDLRMGLKLLRWAFSDGKEVDEGKIRRELVEAAQLARRESILALEKKLNSFSNPFMQNVFRFVVDGVDAPTLKDVFESEIELEEENQIAGAKMWTDAGGYSPTIGIIGAVLGLIAVMQHLTDTSKLGAGIAVAFVATIYGVASANLVFLPIGSKIKRKVKKQSELKRMILDGAISIMTGLNPYIIEQKMRSFTNEDTASVEKAS